MDIRKEKNNKQLSKVHIIIIMGVILALIIYIFNSGYKKNIDIRETLVNKVEQGTLNIQVEGYGKLRSSKQKLLTSQSNATVDEIVLKPGAVVGIDSIILQLRSPALDHEVNVTKQEYTRQQAILRKLKLIQVREVLANEEKFELIKADYETVAMREVAMQDLVVKGIVSKLDFSEVKLKVAQLKKRVAIIEKMAEKLKLVHDESINIQNEAIGNAKSNYNTVLQLYEQLTVRAGMNGILQKLPVELGQSLAVGEQVALIGGTEDLVALVKVPQADAAQVRVGQNASIDTRKNIIEAKVIRVSPTVEDGSVEIEIALTGTLPAQLRPEQNIDAIINIEKINAAYFIQRPTNVVAFSTSTLYKLSEDQLTAYATPVEFGVTSGRFIQIISGASSGESLIVSDLSYLNNIPEVALIQ